MDGIFTPKTIRGIMEKRFAAALKKFGAALEVSSGLI
jgi:hypothetical protein